MDWWLEFARENGMVGIMFAAGCYGARWMAENVAKPLVQGHLQFLDAYRSHMKETDEWLECHADSLKILAANDASQSNSLDRMADNFDRLKCRNG